MIEKLFPLNSCRAGVLLSLVLMIVGSAAYAEPQIDLKRYMGVWYEIARYPNKFQDDCGAARVQYELKDDHVTVINTCKVRGSSELDEVTGRATLVNENDSSKLKVSFVPFFKKFGLFGGDYWILHVDSEYSFALVGHPDQKYFWLLSREPELEESKLKLAFDIAAKKGYSREKILFSPRWQSD